MFRTEDIIDEIIQWIDSNLHKPLKIEDVAARAVYSKWHLQRIFLQVKEVSLGKYIKDKKLRLAAKDLIETNEPVMGIVYKYYQGGGITKIEGLLLQTFLAQNEVYSLLYKAIIFNCYTIPFSYCTLAE
ncbi:hypothetical protein [Leclercia sp. Marseille-Q4284]|uniref:hypothetical protein n=1 Tax=Leclercia sp. Marseille-Q4284 TaxID=2866582 RepID=UPI001CE40CD0|nr:hypothetical protein [Leclercia sp. Marseille-Q4284]